MAGLATGALVLLAVLTSCLASPTRVGRVQADGLSFTLVHVNDMHARYEQTNKLSGTCSANDAKADKCYGGHARVATIIKQARAEDPNALVLNAGDTYQGTVYYSIFKANISAKFINLLDFDGLTIGNHEFDDHVQGLVPFLKELKQMPVVANLDFSAEPTLAELNIPKSKVVERAGVKIGIIGYLTPDTTFLSSVDNVTFSDEIEALTAEAAELKKQGVNIIIGLGHSGYDKDKEIALKVPDMDVVVGGHSHSFLYTGPAPDAEVPVGLYPTWITQPSGRRVPVVQAYAFTKYAGKLKLTFDVNGELTDLQGGPILLDHKIEQDPDILAEVNVWKSELEEKVDTIIGRTAVLLDGTTCRKQECNLGNLAADAYVMNRAQTQKRKDKWTDGPIAILNGGSIRTSIDAASDKGDITVREVMEVIPFENVLVLVKLTGSVLLEAFEHSVEEYVPGTAWKGAFLQVSGVRVTYDVSKPAGQRVVSLSVRCGDCLIPSYSPVQKDKVYGVIVNGFMFTGGDGFSMLANNQGTEYLQDTETAALQDFIEKQKLVYPGVEGRIKFVTGSTTSTTPIVNPTTTEPTTPKSSAALSRPTAVILALAIALAVLVR